MHAFVSNDSPGVPGRKRCPLAEIRNPDLKSRNSGDNGIEHSLVIAIALLTLIVGSFYLMWQTRAPAAASLTSQRARAVFTQVPEARPDIARTDSSSASNNFGWLTFIATPLYAALRLLHDHGIGNWGWSIIVLTVIFNLMIIWPRVLSMRTSLKMMRLRPKVEEIKKRYVHLKIDDPKRVQMNHEMMDLYKSEGANMFGGCLPLLLQMPLLFAFMRVLRDASELHQAHWLWLMDLSTADPLHILPLLIIASMMLTQIITPASGIDPSQKWVFTILTPAIMGVSLWHYASGLSLYWLTGNIISLITQLAINRSKLGREMRVLAVSGKSR